MYVKTIVKSALIAATALCGLSLGGAPDSAEAAEYYTRKRVNGVWITGRFAKKQPSAAKVARSPAVVDAVTTTGALPSSIPSDLSPSNDLTPMFQRAMEARRAAVSIAGVEPQGPSPSASPAHESRLLPLQRALEARAKSMVGESPLSRTVKVVTFNFETGVRTSIYNDGSIVEEAFDPVAAPLIFARR
jgi:hypothetical protein